MTLIFRVIILVNVVFLFLISEVDAAKDTFRLGVLIPTEGLNLSSYIPTMEFALETVENDTTLPFKFSYTLNDSMVGIVISNAYCLACMWS